VSEQDADDLGRADDEETVVAAAESLLIFENAALPLTVILPSGHIAMANRAMRTLLAYGLDELIGKSVLDVVVGDRTDLTDGWDARLAGGERVTTERVVRLRCRDGAEVDVRASSVLVTDGSGAVRYVVARATPAKA
jgi:PAS domain S-box-containing protein